jgi:hypothetical protein
MNKRYDLLKWVYGAPLLALLLSIAAPVLAAPVSEKEILEIARFWYPAEVNHYYDKGWKRDRENKS